MSLSTSQQLDLSTEEVNEMRRAYEKELIELNFRVEHVKSILSKLGGTIPQNTAKKAVAKAAAPKRKRRKKRGPKSVWGDFILDRLKKAERPLSYSEMLEDAMLIHSLSEDKRSNAKASILNSAFRLRTVHKKIDTMGADGRKEKFLVLAQWKQDENTLIEPYQSRYLQLLRKQEEEFEAKRPQVDPNAPPKRRGRPPGSINKKKSTTTVAKKSPAKRGRKKKAK